MISHSLHRGLTFPGDPHLSSVVLQERSPVVKDAEPFGLLDLHDSASLPGVSLKLDGLGPQGTKEWPCEPPVQSCP